MIPWGSKIWDFGTFLAITLSFAIVFLSGKIFCSSRFFAAAKTLFVRHVHYWIKKHVIYSSVRPTRNAFKLFLQDSFFAKKNCSLLSLGSLLPLLLLMLLPMLMLMWLLILKLLLMLMLPNMLLPLMLMPLMLPLKLGGSQKRGRKLNIEMSRSLWLASTTCWRCS